jgi:hypothetical protein
VALRDLSLKTMKCTPASFQNATLLPWRATLAKLSLEPVELLSREARSPDSEQISSVLNCP